MCSMSEGVQRRFLDQRPKLRGKAVREKQERKPESKQRNSQNDLKRKKKV